jgi:transcriptional regulator with PAS, ATPase and Fis domain
VRARVIAATNQPLEERMKEGAFRADLYYRLNVIRIELPSLRARLEDLVPLVDRLLAAASEKHQRQVLGISAAAMRKLSSHHWPGNVRELANTIERAVAMSDHDTILPDDFELPPAEGRADFFPSGQVALEEVERAYVKKVVEEQHGYKSAAAKVLGINRRTLYRKLGDS